MPAKLRDRRLARLLSPAIPSSTAVRKRHPSRRYVGLWAARIALVLCASLVAPLVAAQAAVAATTIGHVDQPVAGVLTEPEFVISGWALSAHGVDGIELVIDGRTRIRANYGIERPDVKAVHGGAYPNNDRAGFDAKLELQELPGGRHEIDVMAIDAKGAATLIGRRVYVNQSFRRTWAALRAATGQRAGDDFHVVFATSDVAGGGAADVAVEYAPFASGTMKFGVRIPILYMRTTKGRQQDWVFDPDFDTSRKCGQRKIAEDSLNGVIAWSIKHRVPVLFTLNGGIWADAACDVPEWDINDQLEQDQLNCQWNDRNQVMADDYLRHLPGSQDAPELARALTLNVYADKVRHYKKRNLQQAARIIRAFADAHPDLFIGVSLDPDVYMNPFFEGAQWYDYNPDTLRQFREWLRGTGPYASRGAGVADLSKYRLAAPFTLGAINALSGRKFDKWAAVDPPRSFKPEQTKLKTPWASVWERFRRHVVDLHYDELSQWVAETGVAERRIFSSQGFNPPGPMIDPFPVRIDSPPKNYDTGGMSVQGSVPSHGHLGAILYGESAIDNIRMEGKASLFRVFRDFDPDWAVVEYNTATFQAPQTLPDAARAYRGLREIINHGARLVSPMAWNGSPGTAVGQPGFVAFTAYRATPLESAARNLMVHRAELPRQARLWGFGFGTVRDTDGWRAMRPARLEPVEEGLQITLASGRARLDSPPALDFRTDRLDLLVVAAKGAPDDLTIEVQGRERDGKIWRSLTQPSRFNDLLGVAAGRLVSLPHSKRMLEQLRLVFESKTGGTLTLGRIALYPAVTGETKTN